MESHTLISVTTAGEHLMDGNFCGLVAVRSAMRHRVQGPTTYDRHVLVSTVDGITDTRIYAPAAAAQIVREGWLPGLIPRQLA